MCGRDRVIFPDGVIKIINLELHAHAHNPYRLLQKGVWIVRKGKGFVASFHPAQVGRLG